jgi:hypothetical protein
MVHELGAVLDDTCLTLQKYILGVPFAGGAHPKAPPRGSRNLLSASVRPGAAGSAPAAAESEAQAEQRQLDFLAWMSKTLLDSLYPGEHLGLALAYIHCLSGGVATSTHC